MNQEELAKSCLLIKPLVKILKQISAKQQIEAMRVQRVQAMTTANRKSIALMEKEKQAKIIVIH
eukprot:512653-Karenia_brevis.AAC.1